MRRLLSTVAIFPLVSFATFTSASSTDIEKQDRIRGTFYGALVADALTLGTHYEYDSGKIQRFYGEIDRYYAPGEKTNGQTHGVGWGARNYHGGNGNGPAKKAGEQTDYGDYNLVILEAVAKKAREAGSSSLAPLEIDDILPTWRQKLKTWRSWICTQTRQTLQMVESGVPANRLGGNSNAMGLRQASLFAAYEKEQDLVSSARAAMFTHRETSAHEGNEFFTRVVARILNNGMTPEEAIKSVRDEPSTSSFIKGKVDQALKKVQEAQNPKSDLYAQAQEKGDYFADDLALTSMARLWEVGKSEPIKVGKASPTEGTLPGSIYFILKYNGNFKKAAIANAMVGGDNASRSIAIGMVMGAAEGEKNGIPAEWLNTLVERKNTEKFLKELPFLSSSPSGTATEDTADYKDL